ncbi:KDO2-lipid IV(A) lauroyltransferase [Spirosomataceae bacterium TFI 002]|nr:KDO2-lipid IV(A) lauroyltransferase [Spirosomataceae bacterium TFI 002]
MKAVVFYLTVPFLYLFSILPLKVLYFLADILLFPLLYFVLGYRKKVVRGNLELSFPEKSVSEINKIEKEFYRHLADLFVEIIKMFTISEKALRKRMTFDHLAIADKWFAENRSFVVTLGHFGNYEWLALSLDWLFPHLGAGPYHKMSNSYFDKLFFNARSRFGTQMFSTKETGSFLRSKKPKPFIVTLANDQSAPPLKSYWTTFLNQDTSFFLGTEKIARDLDMPVVFATIEKKDRGYYHTKLEVICEYPKEVPQGAILSKHAELLERDIKENPAQWLWTHRRWKHKKPANVVNGFVVK